MASLKSNHLLDPLFAPDRVRAIFSEHTYLQGMLDFEAALARAEGRAGVIPVSAVGPIESQCKADLYDVNAIAQATALAGNPAIPLIKELTAKVARVNDEAARYVHWGATSQDAMDTGLVLQLQAMLDFVEKEAAQLSDVLAALADTHKRTPIAGRTWLQHATPVTLGLKVAGWLSAIERDRVRLKQLRPRISVLQFGGAAGTLAALGDKGITVATLLATDLGLELPETPWHTQRDRVTEVATTLGLLAGTLGKMARDISLLMQTEIAEAFEPAAAGRGTSSTMPHKRNPVGAAIALAAASRVPALVSTMMTAMVQEHERGLGGWQAEWETLPEIGVLTAGALTATTHVLSSWEIDVARMRQNIDLTRGLILAEAASMALAKFIGRAAAHELIEHASQRALEQGKHLRDVLAEDKKVTAHISAAELGKIFDPANYLGSAEKFVERVLTQRVKGK